MLNKRILLVEDNPTDKKIISYSLIQLGLKVIEANDGVEAIEKIYCEKPDLVLLDIMIPKLSGYAVCTQIKSDPQIQKIPVIFCTSKNDESDYHEAMKYGADGYLSKPFKYSEILAMIVELGMAQTEICEKKYIPTLKKGCIRLITLPHKNYTNQFA
ncbi:PleD family two-component system response regulator [Okeania sp. SIO2B3]|uniref:response regulator n=1 Tax=Okeania sp. SIO2B3 TaxID=2607784 RepID=UPI0013BFAEE7|nr:response regulator [Okeania sp. SIO2B3]NET45025.1 response regulator [Okeania sp. SIO2B3]